MKTFSIALLAVAASAIRLQEDLTEDSARSFMKQFEGGNGDLSKEEAADFFTAAGAPEKEFKQIMKWFGKGDRSEDDIIRKMGELGAFDSGSKAPRDGQKGDRKLAQEEGPEGERPATEGERSREARGSRRGPPSELGSDIDLSDLDLSDIDLSDLDLDDLRPEGEGRRGPRRERDADGEAPRRERDGEGEAPRRERDGEGERTAPQQLGETQGRRGPKAPRGSEGGEGPQDCDFDFDSEMEREMKQAFGGEDIPDFDFEGEMRKALEAEGIPMGEDGQPDFQRLFDEEMERAARGEGERERRAPRGEGERPATAELDQERPRKQRKQQPQ